MSKDAPGAANSADDATPSTSDDSVLRSLVGYQVRRADIAMRQAFARRIGTPFGLTPVEFSVLVLLGESGQLTHKQLSEALAVAPSNMVLVVGRLRKRELITRTRNPDDGRSIFLLLTDAGQALRDQARAEVERMEDEMFAGVDRHARAQLLHTLRQLRF